MPKGFFDVPIPHPNSARSNRFILVDSTLVDYLFEDSNANCIIHLKDGQQIATLLPCAEVQNLIDQVRQQQNG
jgi:hypothetical protein